MRIAATLLLLLVLGGCVRADVKVDGRWKPERPHPTQEEIKKAASEGPKVEVPPTPFTLYAYPEVVTAYSGIKVTCLIPEDVEEGRYRFEMEGASAAEGPINRREISQYFRVGCEPVRFICIYAEYISPIGFQEPHTKILEITPAGDCR
jgi:hypothetical protein